MNKLSREERSRVINCLIEGCSIRSTVRMTGIAKKTVMRLLSEVGNVCARYQDEVFRNLPCKRIQVDELWAFVYCKEKNITAKIAETNPKAGDVWLWVAMDADTKLVPSWLLGGRDAGYAFQFISDLAGRLANRIQLTSDGHKAYLSAVEDVFGMDVDYAMLVKLYGDSGAEGPEKRYSPGECLHARKEAMIGNPDINHVSTSFVERQNLSCRMMMRRYTRLTNAFSKKLENHSAAVALNYFAYNFLRIHSSLRCTPAMAAGVTKKLWEVSDLVTLWEADEAKKKSGATN
jgi:IS1 family transposase